MDSLEVKQTDKFINYELALSDMQNRVDQIITKSKNEMVWFLNHNHIYTQGTSSSDQEILKKNNIPIFKTNRGGKTTYHGPGQRIVYFMIDLNKRNKDLRKFISLIENSLINILYKYHIESTTFRNSVGIWVIKNQGKTLDK